MEYKLKSSHVEIRGTVVSEVREAADPATLRSCAVFTVAVKAYKRYFYAARPSDFQKVMVWGDLAEDVIKNVNEGDEISLAGEICVKEYVKYGEKHTYREVYASSVNVLKSARPTAKAGGVMRRSLPAAAETVNTFFSI